jgi:chromosome segregation ATPase
MNGIDNDLVGGPITDTGLPFGMKVDTYAEDTIKDLLRERGEWQAQAEKYVTAYEELERRVYKNAIADADLPQEIVRRLNRLENVTTQYQAENKDLREKLNAVEYELAVRESEITGQKNRLKGAGKKVRNAKDVAGKQEEKAKTAVNDKQLRIASERKMKQERDQAAKKAQSLEKLCDDLQTNLDVERSGRPHLRKGDTASETTTAVIPIELSICREDFLKLSAIFDSNQMSVTDQLQRWYEEWKKPKEEIRQVVGASYNCNKENGKTAIDLEKLYADMVELVDGQQQTGAEHDGPRSKHSLEKICRKAEDRHNTQA